MTPVPWIRLYTSFFDHPKTRRLRRLLGTVEPIQRLWCWAADCCPSGDLTGQSEEDIEESAHWRGEAGKCFSAMVDVGFIDVEDGGRVTLHGWDEKTGEGVESLTKTREANRVRSALRSNEELMGLVKQRDGDSCRYCSRTVNWFDRRGELGGTYDHVVPIPRGGNSLDNVVVACRSCNSRKKGKTPEEAFMRLVPPTGKIPVNYQSRGEERRGEERREENPIPPIAPQGGQVELIPSAPKVRKGVAPSEAFAKFWESYPRHVAKQAAIKAWPGDDLLPAILKALEWQAPEFRKREPDRIPHPATWLNGRRWEDERPRQQSFGSRPCPTPPRRAIEPVIDRRQIAPWPSREDESKNVGALIRGLANEKGVES